MKFGDIIGLIVIILWGCYRCYWEHQYQIHDSSKVDSGKLALYSLECLRKHKSKFYVRKAIAQGLLDKDKIDK